MTTRFDMFRKNMINFLLEQEKRLLISKDDYNDFYEFMDDWLWTAEDAHPREENTKDCEELKEQGKHI